jgi:hypothetical protein
MVTSIVPKVTSIHCPTGSTYAFSISVLGGNVNGFFVMEVSELLWFRVFSDRWWSGGNRSPKDLGQGLIKPRHQRFFWETVDEMSRVKLSAWRLWENHFGTSPVSAVFD